MVGITVGPEKHCQTFFQRNLQCNHCFLSYSLGPTMPISPSKWQRAVCYIQGEHGPVLYDTTRVILAKTLPVDKWLSFKGFSRPKPNPRLRSTLIAHRTPEHTHTQKPVVLERNVEVVDLYKCHRQKAQLWLR